jgi:hypothetical protein
MLMSWISMLVALKWMVTYRKYYTEAQILGRNPDESLKSFLPCFSLSPLQLCLEISISSNSRNLLHISTGHLLYTVKEKGGKPDRKPYPFTMVSEIHTETSSLRTLKIMPRNLNEFVRS